MATWFSPEDKGEKVPEQEEIIRHFETSILYYPYYIEIKNSGNAMVQKLMEVLCPHGLSGKNSREGQVVIESFHKEPGCFPLKNIRIQK